MLKNFYNHKKVLITGYTGFKGAWLTIWLKYLGAEVVGYALQPPTKQSLFKICRLGNQIKSVRADIRDVNRLYKTIKKYKPSIVFHLAAQSLVSQAFLKPRETYEVNVLGTVNLLEACRLNKSVRAIVNVTSDKCYQNQDWLRGYRETDRLGGNEPYSSSKACAELVARAYWRSFFKKQNCFLASARSGNAIGGGDWAKDRLIPDCLRALRANRPIILRHPEAVRPWQHVLEPLFGYLLLAKKLYQKGSSFVGGWNFGPEDEAAKTVRWLTNKLIRKWGSKATLKSKKEVFREARYLKLDSSKAKTKLGWYPCWDLSTAIDKTIIWYKAYYRKEKMLDFSLEQIKDYENHEKGILNDEGV